MIIYYYSEEGFGVEVYNGVKEAMRALESTTSFDNAVNIAARSGDLFIDGIESKNALIQQLPNVIDTVQATTMRTYFVPTDSFISKEKMSAYIKEVIAGADDSLIEMIMFSMTPVAFFGELSEEEIREEIALVRDTCISDEDDEEAWL